MGLKQLFNKLLPKKLKAEENAEAMALAAMKGVEICAQMLIKSNGLMSEEMMAAQFRLAAINTSQLAKEKDAGSFENVGLEFMATQLSEIADNILLTKPPKNAEVSDAVKG